MYQAPPSYHGPYGSVPPLPQSAAALLLSQPPFAQPRPAVAAVAHRHRAAAHHQAPLATTTAAATTTTAAPPATPAAKKHACPHCAYSTDDKTNYNKHVRTKHEAELAKKFPCRVCQHLFLQEKAAKEHASTCTGTEVKLPYRKPTTDIDDYDVTEDAAPPLAPRARVVYNATVHADMGGRQFEAWLCTDPIMPMDKYRNKIVRGGPTWVQNTSCMRTLVTRFIAIVGEAPTFSALVQRNVVEALISDARAAGNKDAAIRQKTGLLKKIVSYLSSCQYEAFGSAVVPERYPAWPVLIANERNAKNALNVRQKDKMYLEDAPIAPADLTNIAVRSFHAMDDLHVESARTGEVVLTSGAKVRHSDLLITALVSGEFPQRAKTFSQLTTDSVLRPGVGGNTGELYQVRLTCTQNKVPTPILHSISAHFTPYLDFHFNHVLGQGYQGPVFLQRGGRGRTDASEAIARISLQLTGRRLTARPFRPSVVSAFAAREDVTDKDMADLALQMNHSQATQQRHYAHIDAARKQKRISDIMSEDVRKRLRTVVEVEENVPEPVASAAMRKTVAPAGILLLHNEEGSWITANRA